MPVLDRSEAGQFRSRLGEILAGTADPKTKLLLLRQLMEGVYRKLSEDSNSSFNGLFARMQYAHARLAVPADLVTQANQLRLLGNKAAHERDFLPEAASLASGVLALHKLLLWLNPDCADPAAEEYLKAQNAQPFPAIRAAGRQSFNCVVQAWKPIRNGEAVTGIEILAANEEGFDCQIYLNDLEDRGKRWSVLNKALWQHCTLNCLNLSAVTGKELSFQSAPTTFIVLEPDFLVDATAVADCFEPKGCHPENFILDKLISDGANEKMTKGNLVNGILDELISSPDTDYTALFRRCMAKAPIPLVSLGKEAANNIYASIRDDHLPQLADYVKKVKQDDIQLEPSFISPEYGLQGRVDILRLADGVPYIDELKSGSASRDIVWINNQMQVVAYNMIIRSCFDKASRGTSSIFYSASKENPLRHVTNTAALEQDLLMGRNRLVGLMHGLAEDPRVFFDWLLNTPAPDQAPFRQTSRQGIVATLRSLEDYEYEWFLEQLRLLVREVWFAKTGGLSSEGIYGHNALWRQSPAAKTERYRLLSSLRVESVEFNLIRLILPGQAPVTDFRAGDWVVLYRQNKAVADQQILRGKIILLNEGAIEVRISGGLRQDLELMRSSAWELEHDEQEGSLYQPLGSLFSFLESEPSQRRLLLGLDRPRTEPLEPDSGDYLDGIVARVSASKQYHIVQGPPGTGKTSGLLTAYVERLFTQTDKTVLILSFTNRAVDEICLCLRRRGIPFIRSGSSDEIDRERLDSQIEGKKFDEIDSILRANRIWVATVSSSSRWLQDLSKIIHIDELIVDEASQIVENSILGSIARIGKTVLIGDQNQLPPITSQTGQGFNFQHPKLAGSCYGGYNQSLMERLFRVCAAQGWTDSITMLNRHYRMHESIAGLIQHYYSEALLAGLPAQKAALPESAHPLACGRVFWIECPPSKHHFYDPLQVRCVLEILRQLESAGVIGDYAKDVGIVAPFRAMIHALLQELGPEQKKMTIDTVERFQGSERRNIIVTLPLHSVGALRNVEALSGDGRVDRKLNVALSRAQDRVIVIGNRELCLHSPHYAFLMDRIRAAGNVIPHERLISNQGE